MPDDPVGVAHRLEEEEEEEELTTRSIETLCAITGGVPPPLRARRDLAATLRSSIGPESAVVVGAGIGDRRFPTGVEIAAYFCCVEAVRGMAPGAELTVDAASRTGCSTTPSCAWSTASRQSAVRSSSRCTGRSVRGARGDPRDESAHTAACPSEPKSELLT